jgi:hypothetical protein
LNICNASSFVSIGGGFDARAGDSCKCKLFGRG